MTTPYTVSLQLTPDEALLVLDGLAAMPLSRSYQLFNKVLHADESARVEATMKEQANVEVYARETPEAPTAEGGAGTAGGGVPAGALPSYGGDAPEEDSPPPRFNDDYRLREGR